MGSREQSMGTARRYRLLRLIWECPKADWSLSAKGARVISLIDYRHHARLAANPGYAARGPTLRAQNSWRARPIKTGQRLLGSFAASVDRVAVDFMATRANASPICWYRFILGATLVLACLVLAAFRS